MSLKIETQNPDLQNFVEHTVNPHVKAFLSATDEKAQAVARRKLLDEIPNAQCIAGGDENAIKILAALQSNLENIAPLGIRNEGNYCWAVALFNTILNSPSVLLKAIHGPIGDFIKEYRKAQLNDQRIVAGEIIQKFAQTIQNGYGQYDLAEAMTHLFEEIGFEYKFVDQNNPNLPHQTLIGLDQPVSLSEGLREFFSSNSMVFDEAPEDLFIQRQRPDSPMEVSKKLILEENFTKSQQKVQYELVVCDIHGGKDGAGHYTSLVKKPEGWYLINDSLVFRWNGSQWFFVNKSRELSLAEAKEFYLLKQGGNSWIEPDDFLKLGTIFHYRKISESLPLEKKSVAVVHKGSSVAPAQWAIIEGVYAIFGWIFGIFSHTFSWFTIPSKKSE